MTKFKEQGIEELNFGIFILNYKLLRVQKQIDCFVKIHEKYIQLDCLGNFPIKLKMYWSENNYHTVITEFFAFFTEFFINLHIL